MFLFYTDLKMQQIDKKKVITHTFTLCIAFLIAYSIDQYYFQNRQLFFLAKPINFINSALQMLSGK